jgi:hypothetical protein
MISMLNETHLYPIGRIILLAIEEILGVQEAADLLNPIITVFQGIQDCQRGGKISVQIYPPATGCPHRGVRTPGGGWSLDAHRAGFIKIQPARI